MKLMDYHLMAESEDFIRKLDAEYKNFVPGITLEKFAREMGIKRFEEKVRQLSMGVIIDFDESEDDEENVVIECSAGGS